MAFCKYSSECIENTTTQVENLFISRFVPGAPDVCVKVYLYGLYKCQNPNAFDNTLENFALDLQLSADDVKQAFLYWEGLGLIEILNGVSFEIRYIPVKNALQTVRKFNKSKYSEFNQKAQDLIEGRMITATELTEYYNLMEIHNIDPKAFLLIIQYCTELKGKNVGYNYILTVARNWANEGIFTYDSVLEKIKSYSLTSNSMSDLLKICGIKRMANIEEQDKFLKWTESFGFEPLTINYVAEEIALKSGKVNFSKLDSKLTNYYEAKKLTVEEIVDYENKRYEMLEIAKIVCKNIGVYYENLDIVVEKYISKWLDLGHTEQSLTLLADFCFKTSTRTLEGLDFLVLKLYKLGIISEKAIEEYVVDIAKQNSEIQELLDKLGSSKNITAQDREMYKTWKYDWNISTELFNLAIQKACGKSMPMQYMNKLLANWHNKGITTEEEANRNLPIVEQKSSPQKQTLEWEKQIRQVDLNALFDSASDIDI